MKPRTYTPAFASLLIIRVPELQAIVAANKVELLTWDILFVLTGYAAAYAGLVEAGRNKLADTSATPYAWPGLEQSEEMVRWLWEKQFAAVDADNPGLECVRELYPFPIPCLPSA